MDRYESSGNGTGAPTPPSGGPRREAPLLDLWNFVQRNRWLVLGVPVLAVVLTAALVQVVRPVYDGATWIRVDEQRANIAVLDALQSLSRGSALGTELQVLRRRPLAEEVMDSLGLQLELRSPRHAERGDLMTDVRVARTAPAGVYRFDREPDGTFAVSADGRPVATAVVGLPVELPGARLTLRPAAGEHDALRVRVLDHDRAMKRFRRALDVHRPDREADLMVVRYTSTDPGLAAAVPDAMARFFIRSRQHVQKSEARSTVAFLNEQLDTLSVQLGRAEDALRVFREGEQMVRPEAEAQVHVHRLSELLAHRDMLDAEREALAELLAEVRAEAGRTGPLDASPYRRLISFPTLLRNFAVSELFRSLADVENQRAELLNRRTVDDPDVRVLTQRVHELEAQLGGIATTYLTGLTNNVRSLDGTLSGFLGDLRALPAREIMLARLDRETDLLEEIYILVQTRLKEAEIAAAVEDASVRVVEPALYPIDPIRPNKPLSLVLALLLGAVLGAAAAFTREHMDTAVHTREDLQDAAHGAPVLGLIPRILPAARGNGVPWRRAVPVTDSAPLPQGLIAGRDPRNPVSEAYRALRTNITFARPDRPLRTLVLTSPAPGDGKSTSAANLAITLAQQGLRCLLVDADMRRGALHEAFGERREPGLSNVLLGTVGAADGIRILELNGSGVLHFMPTGTVPPNPAELLGADRMKGLLDRLEPDYDLVILDAPPLTLVTDGALLGSAADGVVIVARSGITDRRGVAYAVEQLRAVGAPLLGVILNDIDARKDRFYGSYATASYAMYGVDED